MIPTNLTCSILDNQNGLILNYKIHLLKDEMKKIFDLGKAYSSFQYESSKSCQQTNSTSFLGRALYALSLISRPWSRANVKILLFPDALIES